MQVSEFIQRAAEVTQEFDADVLCFEWLLASSKDQGKEGEIAIKALEIAEQMICP